MTDKELERLEHDTLDELSGVMYRASLLHTGMTEDEYLKQGGQQLIYEQLFGAVASLCMSGYPSRTCAGLANVCRYLLTDPRQFDILQSGPGWRGPNGTRSIETPRLHHAARRRGGGVAVRGARNAIRKAQ